MWRKNKMLYFDESKLKAIKKQIDKTLILNILFLSIYLLITLLSLFLINKLSSSFALLINIILTIITIPIIIVGITYLKELIKYYKFIKRANVNFQKIKIDELIGLENKITYLKMSCMEVLVKINNQERIYYFLNNTIDELYHPYYLIFQNIIVGYLDD